MFPGPARWFVALATTMVVAVAPSAWAQSIDRGPEPVRTASSAVDAARPKPMLPLYSTLAVLHAADAILTVQGLDAGIHEQNPLMRGNRSVMTLTKVLSMATTIAVAEKMWKRNRAAAIATMVAANVVTAAVVARNVRSVNGAAR